MNRQTLTLATALCCGACLYLLGGESEQQLDVPSAIKIEIEQPVAAESPAAEHAEDAHEGVPESLEAAAKEQAVDMAFAPPYLDRVTLFQAPKRHGKGLVKSNGQTETAVELLGFVNVNGQRVVLSIDGLVSPIAVGGKEYGIEVISIQSPTVVLQRGRQRWQASLGN